MRYALPILIVLAVLPLPLAAADHGTFIVAGDSATDFGDAVTFAARLLEPDSDCAFNVCPVVGRQVDFYIDGAYLGTDVTNSGGYAYLRVEDSSAWHVGIHEIRAQYDRYHGGAAVDLGVLTVTEETTVLVAREGYFEARLTDDDATPLAGELVRFSYVSAAGEQDVCDAYTDLDGVASCASENGAGVTPLDLAQTSYKATFDGTSDLLASTDDGALV